MKLSLIMHRRNPGFEVKAVISFKSPGTPKETQQAYLREMCDKLGKTVPGSFRAKYNMNAEDLVVLIKTDKASAAQSIMRKMEDFIHSSAVTLKSSQSGD